MIPRAEAPARRLPYTTADMSERLAKRKAEQEAAAFKAFPGGVTKPFVESGGSKPSWLSQVGGMIKNIGLTAAGTALDAIPYVANIPGVKGEGAWGYEPEDAGTSNFFQAGGQALEQSGRRLVGDVTAIPGLGKDSPSYTADQIRKYGVAEGLASAGLDYGNLALTVAPFVKPTGMAIGNAINDAKYAAYLRRTKSPFPAVERPANVIDVDALQGSRLPARVVDSPAPPATRLAEAQTTRALPPSVQRALPPAEIAPAIAEPPPSRLSQPAWRERQVPTSSRLTVETDGPPDPQTGQEFIIRAFDNTSDEYKGALTMYWDPIKQKAIVDGMGATNAMVTPQLVSSAAYIIKKYYGDIPFPLEPSSNLSAYSRPFVERLQKAGLVDPDFILPEANEINSFDKSRLPDDFADEFSNDADIIPSLAYQPTYNDVLRALVESKRKAKSEGEYGKLATSSQKLRELKWGPNTNDAAAYRSNMEQFGFPIHPLFEQASDARINILLDEIKNGEQGASMLIDVWDKLDPALIENAGVFADSYALTRENLLKFPQLLQDSNLIDGRTRQRLLIDLQDLLE